MDAETIACPHSPAAAQARWNFVCGILNGVLINGALACINGAIILAPLIQSLTGSTIWAGAMANVSPSFFMLPQMATSGFIESRAYKLPVYRVMGALRLIGWSGAG